MKTYTFNDLCEALPSWSKSGIRKKLMQLGVKRAKGCKYLVFTLTQFNSIIESLSCTGAENHISSHREPVRTIRSMSLGVTSTARMTTRNPQGLQMRNLRNVCLQELNTKRNAI